MASLPGARKLILAIALAILVFAALIHFSDSAKVIPALLSFPPLVFLALISLITLSLSIRICRWSLLLAASDTSLPLRRIVAPFLISQAASLVTPGKAGDPLRCFLLTGHKVRKTLGSVVVERVLDFILLILLSVSLLIGSDSQAIIPVIAAAILILAIIAVFSSRLVARLIWKAVSRISLAKKYEQHVIEFYYNVRDMSRRKELPAAAILTGFAWAVDFFRFTLVLHFLGYPVSLLFVGQVLSAALIVGTLSMLPGGLGGQEIAVITLFSTANVPLHIISAAIIIDRLVSYWYPIFLGFFAIPYR